MPLTLYPHPNVLLNWFRKQVFKLKIRWALRRAKPLTHQQLADWEKAKAEAAASEARDICDGKPDSFGYATTAKPRPGRPDVEMTKWVGQALGIIKTVPNTYRKKPVVIHAEQYLGQTMDGVCLGQCKGNPAVAPHIHTLEGEMTVSPRDWVITGVNGEKYPCKPDIFEKTYEPVIEEKK